MRRTTLGALTPLTNRNSEELVRGGRKRLSSLSRISVGRPQQETGSRLSAGGRGSNSRRSGSFYGKPLPTRSDPRSLNDRAYMQKSIHKLINFLAVHNYDRTLSPKLLQSPTSKEFYNIVQFLFKMIEPSLEFAKMEDDVPALFRLYGYPFTISKNALCAVGSPLTWPSLLGALTWLVDLLESEERGERGKVTAFDGNGIEPAICSTILESYDSFIAGEDETILQERWYAELDKLEEGLEEELQTQEEEVQNLHAHLEAMEKEPSVLKQLEAESTEKRIDIEKFNSVMSNNTSAKISLEQDKRTLEERRAQREAEHELLMQEIEQLEAKVREQVIDKDDVDRLTREINSAKATLQTAEHQKEQLQKKTWDLEIQMSKQIEALEAAVREYHALGERLKVIPSTAKRAGGVTYAIELNSRAKDLEKVLSADLKGVIKPGLAALKKDFNERHKALQDELDKEEEKHFNSNEVLIESKQQLETIEAQNKKLEAKAKGNREMVEKSAQSIEEQVQQISDEVIKTKSAAYNLRTSADDLLKATESEYELEVTQKDLALQEMRERTLELTNMAVGFKEYILARLKQVHSLTKQTERDIAEVL